MFVTKYTTTTTTTTISSYVRFSLYRIVLFRQLPCLYILMGIVPSLIGSVYVYMYAVDSPKRQEEAMNTGSQSPSSFRLVSWLILRADRDTGLTA